MLNYVLGAEWKYDWRFQMEAVAGKERRSQTRAVAAYIIYPRQGKSRLKYPVTIVDTPGFGDAKGLDEVTISELGAFFKHKDGIDCLHSIALVVPASTSKLNASYIHVYRQLENIFGKEVIQNIHLLLTSADGSSTPPALEVVKRVGLPYNGVYAVNNCCLYESSRETEVIWNRMMISLGEYFGMLENAKPVSDTMTKEVLMEREAIEMVVPELHKQIRKGNVFRNLFCILLSRY